MLVLTIMAVGETPRARVVIGEGAAAVTVTVVERSGRGGGSLLLRVDAPPGTRLRRGEWCCPMCLPPAVRRAASRFGPSCRRHGGAGEEAQG